MKFVRSLALALPLALSALPLSSHPHVFIDAGVNVIFDEDGKLAAIHVFWAYDEFYSLSLIEEQGLDADRDGIPEPDALAAFAGKDADWAAGFPGDLYLTASDEPIALARPIEHGIEYDEGRIVTHHIRALETRIDPGTGPVVVQVYDPSFFVAYDMRLPVTIEGRDDCKIDHVGADLNAAYDKVERLLYGPDSAEYANDQYPAVGDLFADTLTVTCSG